MVKKCMTAALLVTLFSCAAMAQDARTVIVNASRAMGADNLNSIEYSGMGADFSVGQAMTAGGQWPKFINKSFTRTINYLTPAAMRTQRVRVQGEYPQNGGGGQPLIGEATQNQVVVVGPNTNWNQQLEFILTPHGFLKAAAAANPPATVANQTVAGRRLQVVSFVGQNKAKINGYINDQNLVEKVETWIDNNMLGDMLWDATFTQYANFGGVQFPRRIVQRQAGFPILDWMAMDVKPNAPAAIEAPAPAAGGGGGGGQQAAATTSKQLGPGVWMVLPAYASIVVDFRDYIVVIGGGNNDARAEATIAEARRLVPNKPIRYVINTHAHFDHMGGLRAYAAEGVTILTHESNRAYFERIFNAPRTLNPDKLTSSKRKVTIEGMVGDKRVLTDGARTIELHKQQGNFHQDGLIFAYLPNEKVLLQADMFNPPADPNFTTPAVINMNSVNLFDNIQRLGLDVQAFVPEHYPPDGRTIGMNEFSRWIGRPAGTSN